MHVGSVKEAVTSNVFYFMCKILHISCFTLLELLAFPWCKQSRARPPTVLQQTLFENLLRASDSEYLRRAGRHVTLTDRLVLKKRTVLLIDFCGLLCSEPMMSTEGTKKYFKREKKKSKGVFASDFPRTLLISFRFIVS
jgi:hypothetical protein